MKRITSILIVIISLIVSVDNIYAIEKAIEVYEGMVQVFSNNDNTLGLKSDGTVVALGFNSYGQCNVEDWKLFTPRYLPEINISTVSSDMFLGDNSIIKFEGTVSDKDKDAITISATINGKKKSTVVKGSGKWELIWNSNEIGEGNFNNIEFTANDGEDTTKVIWENAIDIRYSLRELMQQIESYIADKSNTQRVIIVNADNRVINNNAENSKLIEEIRSLLEKKKCQLYFVGGDNQITKDLAEYLE